MQTPEQMEFNFSTCFRSASVETIYVYVQVRHWLFLSQVSIFFRSCAGMNVCTHPTSLYTVWSKNVTTLTNFGLDDLPSISDPWYKGSVIITLIVRELRAPWRYACYSKTLMNNALVSMCSANTVRRHTRTFKWRHHFRKSFCGIRYLGVPVDSSSWHYLPWMGWLLLGVCFYPNKSVRHL